MVSQFASMEDVPLLSDLDYSFPPGTHVVGRLDALSEGLLLLTTNGQLSKLLFKSKVPHKRTYLVRVNQVMTDEKVKYTRNKAFDRQYYMDFIENFLSQHQTATRQEIDELILDKLPDFLNLRQKRGRVHNLLCDMVESDRIENIGSRSKSQWVLKKQP